MQSIPAYFAYQRRAVKKIVIPNNVITIGDYAFSDCSGIDSLYFGSGLTSIGSESFRECTGIKFMYYNAKRCESRLFYSFGYYYLNGRSYYPAFAFDAGNTATRTDNFTTLVIGDSVQSIPGYFASGRYTIKKIVIPDNVTSIGAAAFTNCSGIDSLYIGSGLSSIGGDAFLGCTGLKYMYYNAKNLTSGLFWT